tara:strand:+ start:384 stop:1529 length:1146 start_codon:yes stop_codon:yes gene_type:complete
VISFLKKILAKIIFLKLKILEKLLKVNFRFTRIEQKRIGHLLTNIDQSIDYMNDNFNNYYLFIYLNGECSNNFIKLQWKNSNRIFYSKLVKRIINLSNYNHEIKKYILDWDITQPAFTTLYSKKKNFFIRKNSLSNSLIKYKILNESFICLHNRDRYFSNIIAKDKNFLDYKNFEFSDFDKTIDKITEDNLIPVRIGKYVESKVKNNKKIFDMTSEASNDELDVLLQYFAKFTIIGSTGLAAITTTLRKPCLYINYLPFHARQLSWVSRNSMVIPKLIKNKNNNKFLRFSELNEMNWDIHQQDDFISNNNLEAISNTGDDILNGYLEMKNFIETKELSKDIEYLNKLVFESFKDRDYANYLFKKTKIRIPENFLKKYQDLI